MHLLLVAMASNPVLSHVIPGISYVTLSCLFANRDGALMPAVDLWFVLNMRINVFLTYCNLHQGEKSKPLKRNSVSKGG